jgi:hypothetical protein
MRLPLVVAIPATQVAFIGDRKAEFVACQNILKFTASD